MQQQYYAHSKENTDKSNWQPLEEHLKATAQLARQFAQSFNSGDWAELLALYHDLGKYKAEFQNGVLNQAPDKKKRVDHSSAGALALLERFGEEKGRLLAQIVIAHHGGLRDPDSLERREQEKEELKLKPCLFKVAQERLPELLAPVKLQPLITDSKNDWQGKNFCSFLMRFLFSALVDADFLDTEAFFEPEQSKERINIHYKNPGELFKKLEDHLKMTFPTDRDQSPLSAYRTQLQESCFKNASKKQGLYRLIAPTGAGKTLATLGFALQHAQKHGLQRVIIALPYLSIIEQTAAVLRSIFGEEQVLEHHSHFDFNENKHEDESEKRQYRSSLRLAYENWDAPLIVTTNVQLFESLYGAGVSQCRKLHRIAKSVIILDEPQALPRKQLLPLLSAIKILEENFAVSWLFSSTTLPAWKDLPKTFPDIPATDIHQLKAPLELSQRTKWYYPQDYSQAQSWGSLALELSQYSQVLCVVNTRADTLTLLKELQQCGKEASIISTYLCAAHRQKLLQQVNEQLAQGKEICLISTQVIEAGVDIDFPVVYRALAGFDSLVQAAGRCNREGKLQQGQFHIFIPESFPPPGDLRNVYQISLSILDDPQLAKKDTATLLKEYFKRLYKSCQNFDANKLKSTLEEFAKAEFPFREFNSRFKLIEQTNRSFYVYYNESEELLKKLEDLLSDGKTPSFSLMRKLQRYQVSVPEKRFQKLKEDKLLQELGARGHKEGVYKEVSPHYLYDQCYGLREDQEFLDVDKLIF